MIYISKLILEIIFSKIYFCFKKHSPVWVGGMYESGIGRQYLLAANSFNSLSFPGDCAESCHYWQDDIVHIFQENNMFKISEKPGLGVDIDEKKIEDLCFFKEVFV